MALCETCMGFEWELANLTDPPPGGYSQAEYWEESKIDIPKPDWEIGGSTMPKVESLREQYELAHKVPEKEDKILQDMADELSVAKVKAEWNALFQAFGEEKALEAKKFYEVTATPREVTVDEVDGGAQVHVEYDIVIKPRINKWRSQLEPAVILCEPCDHGIHEYHKEAAKKEPCECVLCEAEGGK